MKIAILNECFFEEEHINRLKKVGEVKVYPDTTKEDEVIERLKDADVGVADMFVAPITEKVLDNCKNLKLLALNTTGFDLVNHKHARELNISVSNVPNFSTDAVAEQAIALMFAVTRKIVPGDQEFRNSLFGIDPGNEEHKKYLGFDLKGKTMGVVGCGNIGSRVVKLAQGLGMNVLVYNRTKKDVPGAKFVGLEELLKNSDVISINLAQTKETENLIDQEEFNLMKSNAILINTARGKIVNTEALYNALKNNKIAGAGLDIVDNLTKEHPMLKLDNVVFSPHSAWYTKEALNNIAEIITKTIESFSEGNPINVIN